MGLLGGASFAAFLSIFLAFCLIYPSNDVISDCALEKCPLCYGTDFCVQIARSEITYTSNWFYRHFLSAKNVHFAKYRHRNVVLKKLAHSTELRHFYANIAIPTDFPAAILAFFKRPTFTNFRLCEPDLISDKFVDLLRAKFGVHEIWTLLNLNAEPLVLEAFKNAQLPISGTLGSCGLITVQEYAGIPLSAFEKEAWPVRVHLAAQLIVAALNFTENHPEFRLYLTDISSDNIVVEPTTNRLSFIDLENVIVAPNLNGTLHSSEFFGEDSFIYSENAICGASVSDHNVYGVCRLLLSKKAPWPMMADGLLHDAPPDGAHLLDLVEDCVNPSHQSRFEVAALILDETRIILKAYDLYLL